MLDDTKELSRKFQETKQKWLMLQNELGERLLLVEHIRLHNANVNRKWLEIFGKEYIRLLEQQSRLEILRRKTLLLEINPDLASTELEEKLTQVALEKQKTVGFHKIGGRLCKIRPSLSKRFHGRGL